MALLHGVTVLGVEVNMPASGDPAGATTKYFLEATTPTGDKVRATANVVSLPFPANETEWVDNYWQGAFAEAYGPQGHTLPETPEWSPYPIV